MNSVSLRAFAKIIGVSLTAVQKGLESGRIVGERDQITGKYTGIDADTQVQAWQENSKHPQKRPNRIAGGRPRKDGSAVASPQTAGGYREGDVLEFREPQPHGGALKRAAAVPAPDGAMTMAEAQRARELVKLQMDELKLEELNGSLISVEVVTKDMERLASIVKAALLSIPDRIAAELAGMNEPHEIHAVITNEIMNAMADLNKRASAGEI